MNPAPSITPPHRLSLARRIDEVCQRFEAAWQAAATPAQWPHLEEYLADTPEPDRSALAVELLALDVYYRRRAGEEPLPAEYQARLPTLHVSWLLRAFAEGAEATPPDSPQRSTAVTCSERPLPAIPGYEVLGELGRGGMGVVYRARQLKPDRVVALKIILSGAHARPQKLARFRAEAETVACLQHANIVQIFDAGEHEGHPYLALELMDGGSLLLDGTRRDPRQPGVAVVPPRRRGSGPGVVHPGNGRPELGPGGPGSQLPNPHLPAQPSFAARPPGVPDASPGAGSEEPERREPLSADRTAVPVNVPRGVEDPLGGGPAARRARPGSSPCRRPGRLAAHPPCTSHLLLTDTSRKLITRLSWFVALNNSIHRP